MLTGSVEHLYDPKLGQKMIAEGRIHGGVNHSCNDGTFINNNLNTAQLLSEYAVLTPASFCSFTKQNQQSVVVKQTRIPMPWFLTLL